MNLKELKLKIREIEILEAQLNRMAAVSHGLKSCLEEPAERVSSFPCQVLEVQIDVPFHILHDLLLKEMESTERKLAEKRQELGVVPDGE